jgi:O-antigen biosynthesis protein
MTANLNTLRPTVRGKFIFIGAEKFYIRGTTYGTFRPDEQGLQFPAPQEVETDMAVMAVHGINSVRVYTPPPLYLLNSAARHGLKVMVGIPWEQHLTFLDNKKGVTDLLRRVKETVKALDRHPAILCYAIGNEIPAPIVRWYGKQKIELFLKRLFHTVKAADPDCLVTYVNYPTTEYLSLPFLDFQCFNVYLETREKLEGYLMRLHNLSGDRPLVLAEVGLDSLRNGPEKQAEVLRWQLRSIFARGCAGTFVFAWTDEWWRGGFEIEDWDFGLVTRQRQPKPALQAISEAFKQTPRCDAPPLPRITVVVCTYNGSHTIRDTLEGLKALDYPDYEVIVVNDGSTDPTPQIVREYPETRLINTENQGLSSARNTGLYQASGEIVAYIDDDAYPDPHWLLYLAYAYADTPHAGIGGPNIPPEGGGRIAESVAYAPGGPVHVLIDDETAEHIPGCNMSFRKSALLEIGGFDPVFRAAGDDVDICWRIQQSGKTIGFHPGAVVWHHRRNAVKAYWRQQKGYGKAEALLEKKWPEKYNFLGHLTWAGRIYGEGLTRPIPLRKGKIFYGTWGAALFQSLYQPAPGLLSVLPLMPEWHLLMGGLTFLSILGFWWAPLLPVLKMLAAGATISLSISVYSAVQAATAKRDPSILFVALTSFLHLIQPFARLYGRLKHGLTPWRYGFRNLKRVPLLLRPSDIYLHWSEQWRPTEDWLSAIESNFAHAQGRLRRGGVFDRWDLQADMGLFSRVRSLLVIEEYGGGKQYLKFNVWVCYSFWGIVAVLVNAALAFGAAFDGAFTISFLFSILACASLLKLLNDTSGAVHLLREAFMGLSEPNAAARRAVADHPPGPPDPAKTPPIKTTLGDLDEPEHFRPPAALSQTQHRP